MLCERGALGAMRRRRSPPAARVPAATGLPCNACQLCSSCSGDSGEQGDVAPERRALRAPRGGGRPPRHGRAGIAKGCGPSSECQLAAPVHCSRGVCPTWTFGGTPNGGRPRRAGAPAGGHDVAGAAVAAGRAPAGAPGGQGGRRGRGRGHGERQRSSVPAVPPRAGAPTGAGVRAGALAGPPAPLAAAGAHALARLREDWRPVALRGCGPWHPGLGVPSCKIRRPSSTTASFAANAWRTLVGAAPVSAPCSRPCRWVRLQRLC
mmetsp:Transcript_79583/g.234009  ORF Transcript_79583/g.234009 Transcript_79583/m.234009 type:complete len:264 (-) Transcript_79583:572-1363(-)